MRLVLNRDRIVPEFFCFLVAGSQTVKDQLAELCKGSTREFINQRILHSIEIPLPPLAEQRENVRRVNALFALADRLEARLAQARRHVDSLTQSILAKAFRGELVPTEAELARTEGRTYESATELLERIRNDQVLPKPTPRTRKKLAPARPVTPDTHPPCP